MAQTYDKYTVGSSGQAGPYTYNFTPLSTADIKVSVDNVVKTVTTQIRSLSWVVMGFIQLILNQFWKK